MITASLKAAILEAGCEIAYDNLTRQLYATDASMYQIVPAAVAFPRDSWQASAVIRAAIEAEVPVTARGAGTGLAGGAIGDGLIVEFSRYNRRIFDLDLERRLVRVESGVVLDQLNTFLKPYGLCFGPDVATSSRSTFGGMIANNSSGAHVPVYGCVADHVENLDLILADGRTVSVGPEMTALKEERESIGQLVAEMEPEIQSRMPEGLLKRWPGYGLDRLLREPTRFQHVFAGSEGTLAAIASAQVRIVPLPQRKTMGLIFFSDVSDAMQATAELMDLKPAAIEHIDRILLDQTRGQLAFKGARDLLELESKPCESILLVEFYDDDGSRLRSVEKKHLGLRTLILEDAQSMGLIWGLRKAGLSLLTGCKGAAKPVTAIEDVAVRPEQLSGYVKGVQSILRSRGLKACFYGHAAAGLLHIRPVLDMHKAEDIRKFREVADETAALVREFKGSFTGEHGVGIGRVEYMPGQVGEKLLGAMRQIKRILDPSGLLNPGKVLPDGDYRIDTRLRMGAGYSLKLPFEPVLAFAAKDGSFISNLEQCNGCGGCRKETPSMCPTFMVTGIEAMSTRGRANTIRAAFESRGCDKKDPLHWQGLNEVLSQCLSCKACVVECPSNVNLPLLKAEITHARHAMDGVPLRAHVFGSVDFLGKLGCTTPKLANAVIQVPLVRKLTRFWLGISSERPLPAYAEERFDQWFKHRKKTENEDSRGRVLLWDDTFVRYHEPNIGKAAVTLLEAAGFEVGLVNGRKCCGRPAFSQGLLDKAAEMGRHNLELLEKIPNVPILFLEPSCYAMFMEEYVELNLPGALETRKRCFLFEQFIDDLLKREPHALRFHPNAMHVAIHAHCHAKALTDPSFMKHVVEKIPGCEAVMLNTGCCGMAGAFGMMEKNYELSKQVAGRLLEQIASQPKGTILAVNGASCRHQVSHLSKSQPKHIVEILASALNPERIE